jgi:hypothetical protein
MSTGYLTSAQVCPTTQSALLLAIVAKLRTDLPDIFGTDATCFVSDVPWPSLEVQDDLFCTVCPTSSRFDADYPLGAGNRGIVEIGTFQVTVWSRLSLDQLEQSLLALTDVDRGLLGLKQRVLRSLAGQQLYADPPTNSVAMLIKYLCPTAATHPPSRQVSSDFSSIGLTFEAPFYWDLE